MSGGTKGQASPRWAILRRFTISKNGSLYLDRLRIVQTPWFGVYLHHIARPDLDRDPHNHPWKFASFVLRGGYSEYVYSDVAGGLYTCEKRSWRPFSFHRLGLADAHRIDAVAPHCVTLVFVGRRVRDWGFWPEDRSYVPWRRYLAEQAESDTTATGTSRTWATP